MPCRSHPFGLAITLLLLGGCGLGVPVEPSDRPDDGQMAGMASDADTTSGVDPDMTAEPDEQIGYVFAADAIRTAPTDDGPSLPPDQPAPAPAAWPDDISFDEITPDTALLPGFLSLTTDELVLDLLAPTSRPDSFTYLERLCIAEDMPEFYCRQRYGN